MSDNNSRPATPVVTLRAEPSNVGRYVILLIPSVLGSLLLHSILFGVFFLFMLPTSAGEPKEGESQSVNNINADPVEEQKAMFGTVDEDPAATESDTDIQFNVPRIGDFSIPGSV